MAESLVSTVVQQLAPILKGEVKLLTGVREEFRRIRDEFKRMTAFLSVAESMEDSDPELKVWVQQVRDVANDTEDVIDEFMLRIAYHHHRGGFHGLLNKSFRFVKNLKARRRLAKEMQSIQSRVREIAEGHQRYGLKFNFSEQGSSSSTNRKSITWHDPRGDALLLEEGGLVGIYKPKKELVGWLVEGDVGLKVVAVEGMGGSGKTTLVKKVYDEASVVHHFESHVWLTVSESFLVEHLLKDMIRQLFSEIMEPIPEGVGTMDNNRLKRTLKDFLKQKRYVIVLDDIWKIDAWEAIKYALPDCNCGSRILITTRDTSIASTCSQETNGNVHHLKPLSSQDSWTLFCQKTFGGNLCPSHLKETSHKILARCEGLPLAIGAISGVLATKDQSRIGEWEMVYCSLGAELEGNKKLESMKKVLTLSYNDLPYYLKICFLCMSIYPEDHEIDCTILFLLWIAEGFVNPIEGKTLEEAADNYLNELVHRNLVEIIRTYPDGMPMYCRIHDLLRAIILSRSKEQNMVTVIDGHGTSWPEKVRRLSIHDTIENVKFGECLSQLRSLVVFKHVHSLSMSSWLGGLLSSSRLLKALHLACTSLETLPDEIFKLFHLRYLNLGNTKVKKISKLIGNLENLEALDLENTYVTELPIEILKLQKLSYLCVYREEYEADSLQSSNGFRASSEIGNLQSLEVLWSVDASEDSVGIVKEVGRLTNLRELGILNIRSEDATTLCSSIEKLKNLRRLSITNSKEKNEILDLEALVSPPRFLKAVALGGRLEKLPHWVASLHDLVGVSLVWSKLRDDVLQYLQDLPNLMRLRLDHAYEGEGLYFKASGFPRLKDLILVALQGLRWVMVEEGAMPHLERLDITSCELVEDLPSGIEHLTKLKSLILANMSDTLTSKLNPGVEGGDHWKLAKIPVVRILVWEDGCWRRKFK